MSGHFATLNFSAPIGWIVRGSLSTDLDAMDEDMLQLIDPSGVYLIDVGWYPSHNPQGRYVGRFVAEENWESPINEIESVNLVPILSWIEQSIDSIGVPQ